MELTCCKYAWMLIGKLFERKEQVSHTAPKTVLHTQRAQNINGKKQC